jgi:hypothetical protein
MTAPPALPALAGLAWSRHKKPGFSTRVASHASGREVRVALMSYPLYEFEAVYDGLASSSSAALVGLGSSSLQSLMGFFLQLLGQAGTFLYTDPDDNAVVGQSIGTGDGETQSFLLVRALGGFSEPMPWVTNVANVYLNGVLQSPSNWAFTAPNSIGFYIAPAAGVAIIADFSYAFQCRFLDDQIDFEEFMSSLWKLDSMKFRSIKANTTAAPPPQWYDFYAIEGTMPTLFADTTTEATTNHYFYNGAICASFSALLTALGISFSRPSPAYYMNASGTLTLAASGVTRFDYDAGSNPKGLLLEGASTNLIKYSQDLTQASGWANNQYVTVAAASGTAPDGTDTANLVTATSTSAVEVANTFSTASAGTNFAASVYAKAGTNPYVYVGITWNLGASNQYAGAVFNLSSGAVTQNVQSGTGVVLVSAAIVNAGNGWYRLAIVATQPTGTPGSPNAYFFMGLPPSATGNTFAIYGQPPAASGGTIYLWGAQIEQANFASSYIATTTVSVSRAADSLSAAAWSAITAGTLYAKADTLCVSQAQLLVQIDDNSASNRASLSFNAGGAGAFVFLAGGSSEAALTAGAISAGTPAQLGVAFQANDFALVMNAGAPATGSSGAVPAFSKFRIAADSAGANRLFGHLAQFGVWNGMRGPNSSLQALT